MLLFAECGDNEFSCDVSRCILMDQRCNGHPDCTDGTDEVGCPSKRKWKANLGDLINTSLRTISMNFYGRCVGVQLNTITRHSGTKIRCQFETSSFQQQHQNSLIPKNNTFCSPVLRRLLIYNYRTSCWIQHSNLYRSPFICLRPTFERMPKHLTNG